MPTESLSTLTMAKLAGQFFSAPPDERQLSLELCYMVPALSLSHAENRKVQRDLGKLGQGFTDDKRTPSGAEHFGNRVAVAEDYYPGMAEAALFRDHAEYLQPLVAGRYFDELGQGTGIKTRDFFRLTGLPAFYRGSDISQHNCSQAQENLSEALPRHRMRIEVADFLKPNFWRDQRWNLPAKKPLLRTIALFGFTPGNFGQQINQQLMAQISARLRPANGAFPGDDFLVSVDHTQHKGTVEDAYNTRVSSQFVLNGLLFAFRLRAIEPPDPADFRFEARFDAERSRVVMHLVSLKKQNLRPLTASLASGEDLFSVRPSNTRLIFQLGKGERIYCGRAFKPPETHWRQKLADYDLRVAGQLPYRGGNRHINCSAWHLKAA